MPSKEQSVRAGDYAVESIGKGNKRGKIRVFRTLSNAKKYARDEYRKGRGVTIDKIMKFGQRTIISKGMGRTAHAKGKYGKQFTRNVGKL